MARVIEFTDGAERGDLTWWTTPGTGASAATSGVLHGTYYYSQGTGGAALRTITTPMSDFYFRAYVKPLAAASVMAFRSGTAALVTMTYNTTLNRWDITGATTGNTGNSSAPVNTWVCLEVHYKISDTVGVLTVRIDGTQVFTFSGDTKPGADSTVNQLYVFDQLYLDDFALDDADWCGLGYYLPLTANGAGDVTQWTPTGGANYANVSIPANDSTFNTGTTGQLDNYGMTTTTIGAGAVLRVVPFARANNPAGGSVNIGLKTNGTDYTATVTTPTSLTWLPGAEYINNPQSGNSWTQAELDALQMTVSVP